jgi:WhiB family redox-sensing transcriptional regulator
VVGGETEVIDMPWRDRAARDGEDSELFFPVGTGGRALEQLAEATAVCHRCPVAGECLAWALDTGQRYGVWGGLSEQQRHQLRLTDYRVSGRAPHLVLISARGGGLSGSDAPGPDAA